MSSFLVLHWVFLSLALSLENYFRYSSLTVSVFIGNITVLPSGNTPVARLHSPRFPVHLLGQADKLSAGFTVLQLNSKGEIPDAVACTQQYLPSGTLL